MEAIRKRKYPMICLNDDGVTEDNFEEIKSQIICAWEEVLPENSAFEKE